MPQTPDEKIEKSLRKEWNKCRHSMRGMKGLIVSCIYCNQTLDEMFEKWLSEITSLRQETKKEAKAEQLKLIREKIDKSPYFKYELYRGEAIQMVSKEYILKVFADILQGLEEGKI